MSRSGYPLPCDLSHDACDVTYPPPHVDRQTPVKTLPSATTVAGGNKIKGKGGVFRKHFGARVGGGGFWDIL